MENPVLVAVQQPPESIKKCAAFHLWKHGFCAMPAFSPP